MPKYNRKCFYCGNEYYCCSSCVSINSWKNTHCSIECFLNSQKDSSKNINPIVINKGGNKMGVLKAAFKKNGRTIDIDGYDLDLGKFDCSDGSTRVLEDFEYFIVPTSEMEHFTLKSKIVKKPNIEKDKIEKTIKD